VRRQLQLTKSSGHTVSSSVKKNRGNGRGQNIAKEDKALEEAHNKRLKVMMDIANQAKA
jgi:hypothetical protein